MTGQLKTDAELAAYRAETAALAERAAALPAESAAMIERFDAATRAGLAPLVEADHEAAISEETDRASRSASADNPNTCEHGYRFENALCPVDTCGASIAAPGRGEGYNELEDWRSPRSSSDLDPRAPRFLVEHQAHIANREWAGAYQAYLCMMSDHGCECVALGFVEWMRARS